MQKRIRRQQANIVITTFTKFPISLSKFQSAKLNPWESCTIINFSALNRNASSWKISSLFNDLRSVFLFFLNWRCWILLFRKRKFPSGLTFQYWICQSWRVGWITVKILFFHWISKLRYYALSLPIWWSSYYNHDNRHIIILTCVGYFGPSDLKGGSLVLDHLYHLMIKWSYFDCELPFYL